MIEDDVRRRTIRLKDYDYTSDGGYFVTICAYQRECLFGEIDVQGNMMLNEFGKIVENEWVQTAAKRPYVVLDEFVVMPNHFHAIVFITKLPDIPKQSVNGDVGARRANFGQSHPQPVGAQRAAPLQPHVVPQSLGAIVRGFKSAPTKRINQLRDTPGAPVWQRNYYEHVIRNESSLNDIRSYILNNPSLWAEDQENPANLGR